MARSRTFRPRINRAQRDRIITIAETLNGGEVEHGFHSALDKLEAYFDVLLEEVDHCPDCDSDNIDPTWGHSESNGHFRLPDGRYWCVPCDSAFDAWEYIGVEDREQAQFPGFARELTMRFEAEERTDGDSEPGTKQSDSPSHRFEDDWQGTRFG